MRITEDGAIASDHCRDCPDWSLCARCVLEADIDARAEELAEEVLARRDATPTVPYRVYGVMGVQAC